jgi:carbon monoxide dehydrogenase subunit G
MKKQFRSELTRIERPVTHIFNFLSDFTNFSHLVPGHVSNWKADKDHCTFEIQGIISMGMRISERLPFEKIVMNGEGKLPFDFLLTSYLEPSGEDASIVHLVLDAEMSTFMAMMAEKPLSDFVLELVSRLKVEMESR